jgi:anti-sigma regulatory factor (Ser/Thr protein kinase)
MPRPRLDCRRLLATNAALGVTMSQALFWSHHATFANDPTSASAAREFVRVALAGHHLTHLGDDVQLVASELATNAMLHARTPFRVTLQGIEDSVLLTVRDGSAALPRETSAQVWCTSGRGLAIVAQISDEWGTAGESGNAKSVWAWFKNSSHVTAAAH